ncbi:putative Mediator of RNA polymerase II transcription subunit 6 [Seiridium unicorne]|uniref:Mediator of RNA polymerase II transcription subunit 6 n=1 Tax=Seiridium unicorne TaxID=138068 RepID=A0ABR2V5M4_9PEZI
MASTDVPLDEIQWHHPQLADSMQGIHSNSVLFYFAESPFFDKTSNNAVIANQAMFNPAMYQYIQTREAFEGRLKTMSGVEFIVAEQPAQMAPGTGTGVWVIRKQTRRKRPGDEDEITVHSSYYVVGYNIYMAPTLADILSFRMATITNSLRKCFPAADEARTWSPAQGHAYKPLPATTITRDRQLAASKEATPMPESQASKASETKKSAQSSVLDARLAEHSFAIQMQYGGEYMDENPITGHPGNFHLSSTGRKERPRAPTLNPLTTNLKTPVAAKPVDKKEGTKEAKTPKTPNSGISKPKRKKTKTGLTPGATPL